MEKNFCPNCREWATYHTKVEDEKVCINDEEFIFQITNCICDNCGAYVAPHGWWDNHAKEVETQYRALKGR